MNSTNFYESNRINTLKHRHLLSVISNKGLTKSPF